VPNLSEVRARDVIRIARLGGFLGRAGRWRTGSEDSLARLVIPPEIEGGQLVVDIVERSEYAEILHVKSFE